MTQDSYDLWEQFGSHLATLLAEIRKGTSVQVSSTSTRNRAKWIVQSYFREIRPSILALGLPVEEIGEMDQILQDLNTLAQSANRRSSYSRILSSIKPAVVKLSIRRDQLIGAHNQANLSSKPTETQLNISRTLEALVPTAALSFKQAIKDMGDESHISFRGCAAELREVLREVVDHFAPDADVISAPNFHLEKNRDKPTMRQKVQFIFKQRGLGETQMAASRDAAEYIEAAPDKLTRSLYNRSSLSTHVSGSRHEVINLLRYTEAILAELLKI